MSLKLENISIINVYMTILGHTRMRQKIVRCSPVAMAVPPMQSISGNNDGTYTSYICPLTARVLGLARLPC